MPRHKSLSSTGKYVTETVCGTLSVFRWLFVELRSFRLLSVRLRVESIRLRTMQFNGTTEMHLEKIHK